MPNIRVIKIVFDTELKDFEIPAFRGAIIQTVGRDHVVFHNHIGDDRFHYKYPVIQYKSEGKKASIVCIKDGVDEIHHFFENNTGHIKIGNSERSLKVENVQINKFTIKVTEDFHRYKIKKWLPVNAENYMKYLSLEGLTEQVQFLENIMVGNILSMAKGLDWRVEEKITVKITNIGRQYLTKFKQSNLISFDLDFKTNVCLPYDIGLGKGISNGYGTLSKF
jgi:hypothetical protein